MARVPMVLGDDHREAGWQALTNGGDAHGTTGWFDGCRDGVGGRSRCAAGDKADTGDGKGVYVAVSPLMLDRLAPS